MNTNLLNAKQKLIEGEYTLVLVRNDSVITSTDRGVKPLIELLETNNDYNEYSAADKVIGKAAAFLYVLLGIKSVYAKVISKHSLQVFNKYNINVSFDILVDAIKNRTNTGLCPMEQAVKNTDNPEDALVLIKETLKN